MPPATGRRLAAACHNSPDSRPAVVPGQADPVAVPVARLEAEYSHREVVAVPADRVVRQAPGLRHLRHLREGRVGPLAVRSRD